MTQIQKIVKAYRTAQGNGKPLSLRDFAEQLSEPLAVMRMKITYGSIQHWEAGKYEPDDDKLHLLIICAKPHTWQWHLASDLRAAKYPSVYEPVGAIGKQILTMVEAENESDEAEV